MKKPILLILAVSIIASLCLCSAVSAKSKLLRLDTVTIKNDVAEVTTEEVIARVILEAAPYKSNASLSALSIEATTPGSTSNAPSPASGSALRALVHK